MKTVKQLTAELKSYKNQLKHTRLINEELQRNYFSLKKEAEHYFAKMDEAYKEQEKMLRDIESECMMTKHNLFVIRNKTGELTGTDAAYHLDLIVRKIKHKFGYKPKMEEL